MEIGQNFKNLPVKYLVLWCLGVPSGSSLTPWRVFKISSNFNFLCSKKRRVAARSLATGSQRPLVARLMHWVLKNLWRGHEVSKVSFFELFGIKFTKICTFGHFCLFQPWEGTLSPYCLFHQFLLPTKILEESMGDRIIQIECLPSLEAKHCAFVYKVPSWFLFFLTLTFILLCPQILMAFESYTQKKI